MSEKSKKIVALILAAGESSRLGKPKQNLKFGNTTLLNHVKEHLILGEVDRTFIVLGAYAKEISKACKLDHSGFIEFKGWNEGMGSSLSYACSKILNDKSYDGILITLSDLPLVEKQDYQKMIKMFQTKRDIVATKSKNTLGVPALFGSDYFDELLQLNGEKGAKQIIHKNLTKVKIFENEKAAVDIDTLEDFLKLNQA